VIRAWQLLQRRHPALKFALVGGTGFVVDATVLMIAYQLLQIDLLIARTLAFFVAASSNWLLNRLFTFSERDLSGNKSAEWMRFVSSAVVSAIPNVGIFYLLMLFLPETLPWIFIAMACGILVGYFCNYQLAKHWVYKSAKQEAKAGDN